ncbi:tRNA (adenosine(37)-N6)-threonylcarbamoyltransferase complex ATPase subunit type 1 TsaE [Halothermothrix orenii]|uniref:tRNA threonylcarbamoyladenosine biosynthesis protein TsaE n=1 Tax=Halothermothrix orenii (strain H 168 / OCM 544 / DSM 9562) TaxID=373903 RepID=B8D0Y8_HALOH|nr:tRNA (adenosine(37)-N6)-threonylcarbamoyltransferase complex ATPase subunit type 1 TsaE [Halothermothrix orenii]ACL68957.1 conserved hypothetical nucleotide-binding protein TIGR00150 [Halothermothrix orenii H 168]
MSQETWQVISDSVGETLKIGKITGELVEPGQIILLAGDLGAGKTVFTRGLAEGLGVDEDVTSPTYNLINEYDGDLPLFHMDLYRLEEEEDIYDIGFEEYLDREGVVVIEWPDIVYDVIPQDFIYVKIEKSNHDTRRKLTFEAEGEKSKRLLEGLAQKC